MERSEIERIGEFFDSGEHQEERSRVNHGKAKVVFELDPSIFQHFDIATHSFVTEKGNYRIEIGSSCLDIVSSAAIKVSSDWVAVDQRKNLPDYFFVSGKGFDVPNEEFERLLGHQIPVVKNPKIRPFNLNSTLSDIDQTWIGKIAKKKIVKEMNKMASTPSAKKMFMDGALNSPFRAGQMGHVEPRMIDSVLLLANGHFWKGVHAYLFGPKK